MDILVVILSIEWYELYFRKEKKANMQSRSAHTTPHDRGALQCLTDVISKPTNIDEFIAFNIVSLAPTSYHTDDATI